MKLNPPFDTFRVEKHAGEYKDFGISDDSTYPLKGVTYPVDYGDIEGYTAEDGAKLDLFVSDNGKLCGFFRVFRPELTDGEHKFYINLSVEEEKAVLEQFAPVIIEQGRFETSEQLVNAIQQFKDARPSSHQ
jgi:hypothetical protein